jgi:putative redox protein
MSRAVVVNGGRVDYVQNISVGHHLFPADEPVDSGGLDAGPDPYELLLAALGACVSITVRMYAERKQWPLESVQVRLTYARVHAEDCAACDGEPRLIDAIDVEVSVVGDLSGDQRRRLIEIAGRCPVHRTLTSSIQISTRPAPEGSDAVAWQ